MGTCDLAPKAPRIGWGGLLLGLCLAATSNATLADTTRVAAGSGAEAPVFGADPIANAKARDLKPQDVIHWEAVEAVEDESGKVTVRGRMTADEGWQIYASNLAFAGPEGYSVETATPPPTKRAMDPISGEEVDVHTSGEFEVTFASAGRWTAATFPMTARYVGCTQVICLFPYTQTMAAPFAAFVATPAPTPAAAVTTGAAHASTVEAAAAPVEDEDLEARLTRVFSGGGESYWMLLALVFVGGLLSNLTPCVYPMIPITLRVLARQGASPYVSAAFYALGIVITYSALGLGAALSGGLFGSLLASKGVNLAFAVVMAVLGLTMLGFGDFSKLQMLGNRLGAGKPSLRNTFLMGAGAGLVAAPCTGPLLAALLAYTAKNNAGIGASTGLLFTYSLGFGLPYVFLGGAAATVSKMKVSPGVQVGVKLLFASVMFVLSLYYLRVPLYSELGRMHGLWSSIAAVLIPVGLVMAVLWVTVPKLSTSKGTMVVPAALLAVGLFSGWQWSTVRKAVAHDSLTWHPSEAAGIAAATAAGKPILIDMWAEWCEACKKMDGTTFADSGVLETLASEWVVIKLDLTEDNEANTKIQEKYELPSLPTLVLLPPDGDVTKRQSINGYVSAAALTNHLRQFTANRRAE